MVIYLIREVILLPVFHVVTKTTAVVLFGIPSPIANLSAILLDMIFEMVRFVYHHTMPRKELDDCPSAIKCDVIEKKQQMYRRVNKSIFSYLSSIIGFLSNALDIATLSRNLKFKGWITTAYSGLSYMFTSGIDEEITESFFNPRAVDKRLIMTVVQDDGKNRLAATAIKGKTELFNTYHVRR